MPLKKVSQGSRDAAATQSPSVEAVTQSAPASENDKTSALPESTVAATPRKQTAIARRHRAAGESSTEASGGGTDLARVLDVASASCVNASIERKGNVFWVSSAAADGTVNVCIIDASNASDVAVYALSDADRPDAISAEARDAREAMGERVVTAPAGAAAA